MGIENLITLYRGVPWSGQSRYLQLANQGTPSIMGGAGTNLTKDELARLAGQYWTEDPNLAERYAGKSGKIKSMKVPSNYIDKFDKFQTKVTSLPSGQYTHAGVYKPSHLVPKSTLKNYPSKINLGKTLANYMSYKDYPGKMLKIGWDQFGDDYTFREKLKGFAKQDLAPLFKRGILKSLGYLGSTPVSAALMTLSPTKLGSAEIDIGKMDKQRKQATSAQDKQNIQKIQQHTGKPLSDYRMSRPASERQHTGHGKSGMGRDRSKLMAHGGLIDIPLPGRNRYI